LKTEGNFIYSIGNNRTKNRQNTFTMGSNNFRWLP